MSDKTTNQSRIEGYLQKLEETKTVRMVGRVRSATGLSIQASVTGARLGDVVEIVGSHEGPPLLAEVVGVQEGRVTLLPFGTTRGIGPDDQVTAVGKPLTLAVGESLLGRVLDGLGQPIDGCGPLANAQPWDVMRPAPDPLSRHRIETPLCFGLRAIDGLLTIGEGQRVGLFAGPGIGKSTTLAQIARRTTADVVVICLVGERGREVRSFIEDSLTEEGLERSVVVVATADSPPVVRLKSAYTATAIAEYFRDEGKRVLLMMDSLTRFARAQRDVGLAAGELPARHGYPASVFAALPRLLERSGNSEKGTITAVYTILVPGDDLREPVADEVQGILDGHIVLSRQLAERGHWPAIDVLQSLSRAMPRLISSEHRDAAQRFVKLLAAYESKRDLITLGAYDYGSNPQVDEAIDLIETLEKFLQQDLSEHVEFDKTVSQLLELV